ncbi:MAG: diguanylate cyclase [Solirubrobacteraceae bacterium]|nr:diguanylate cyclase [Solirubrobacteraceae bacterium]
MATPGFDDALDVRFRLRAVHVGVGLSILGGLTIGAYALATWDRPHRTGLLVVAAVALLLALAAERLPWDTIARSRMAEPAFVAWSALLVAVFATAAGLDGGLESPLTFALFLPLAYAANSYPTRSMLAVGAADLLALGILVAVGEQVPAQDAAVVGVLLTIGAMLCVSQARNQGKRQAELAHVSRSDVLTGALNRHGLRERLDGELSAADRTARPLALVIIDLEAFHHVNQTQGHDAGDDLLVWVTARLRDLLRPSDALGRTGGDEFTIVAPTAGHAEAELISARVAAALSERTSVAIGIAAFPQDAGTAAGLQAAAATSLIQARAGRNADARDLGWAAALAQAIDLRLAVASDHSGAVGKLAVELSGRMGLRDDDLSDMRLAGSLHDIGKSAVPATILDRAGDLDAAELLAVRRRMHEGADLVRRVPGMERIADWISASLEHWDGTGYPDGLLGDAIPVQARILHVADAFDALTNERPYRPSITPDEALAEIEQHAGTQFDPAVVQALAALVETDVPV